MDRILTVQNCDGEHTYARQKFTWKLAIFHWNQSQLEIFSIRSFLQACHEEWILSSEYSLPYLVFF